MAFSELARAYPKKTHLENKQHIKDYYPDKPKTEKSSMRDKYFVSHIN